MDGVIGVGVLYAGAGSASLGDSQVGVVIHTTSQVCAWLDYELVQQAHGAGALESKRIALERVLIKCINSI